jgi:hypothetical protein
MGNGLAVSAAVFLLALGENLWKRFFGSCQDFLDGVYQYPGGWIGDRFGRREAGRAVQL